ncbi:PucR family transcriptional regulator [Rhodococcus sp. ACT016]|uniref:PucR family transcriptional regulator n=1 Tax=Rhodococcus sp. ACT016 TaxID=3134808 RepID=UPI003D29675B
MDGQEWMLDERTLRVLAEGASMMRRDVDSITEDCIDRGMNEIPSYRAIPVDDLRNSLHRNVMRSAEVLECGDVPAPETVAEATGTTAERAAQGIPIEDIIRGYRLSITVIYERFNEWAAREQVDPAQVLAGARLLWRLGDHFISQAAVTYQRIGIENALEEDRARTNFIRDVVTGSFGSVITSEHGLSPTSSYHPLIARPIDGVGHHTLRQRLESTGRSGDRAALTCVWDERCIGLSPRKPDPGRLGVVALGPSCEPASAAAAMQIAELVYAVAAPRGVPGVYTLDDVTWRAAARCAPVVGEWLRDRYLNPIRAQDRSSRELEGTLAVFLEHRRNVQSAAAALVVHPNTLRYRLNKIQALLDVDLECTDVIIGLSWALEIGID